MTLARALALAFPLISLTLAAAPAHAAEDEAEPPSIFTSSADEGTDFRELFHINTGLLDLVPIALMQVQGVPYVGGESFLQAGDAAERGGFRLRRARFGFGGKLAGAVPFAITAEFSSDDKGTARLHDAWFGYDKHKGLQIFAGARDVPFSRSALVDAGNSALIERPLAVRAMAPFHQLGVSLEGQLWSGALNYAAGVYNGLQRTDQFFQGYTENAAILGNRFDGLTYAARLSSDPLGSPGRAIEDLYHDRFRVSLGSSFFFSNGGTRNILGVGGDFLIHFRGLHVLGELLTNRAEPSTAPTQPTAQTSPVKSLAVVGEAGYVVLKRRLGVTARFEWLNPNTAVDDESDCWLVTGGVSYHVLRDLLKAQLDYTHRQEIQGKSLQNDALVLQLSLNL